MEPAQTAMNSAMIAKPRTSKLAFSAPTPSQNLPVSFNCRGFAVAIQLVAKPFQEPTLFRVADAFEKATPFRGQRPALVVAHAAA
jgi:Asp-tRNA(Asn)/Glu-tRNA(Gln) amidotransferase A subunit family amidase